jgi:hypothetical protein
MRFEVDGTRGIVVEGSDAESVLWELRKLSFDYDPAQSWESWMYQTAIVCNRWNHRDVVDIGSLEACFKDLVRIGLLKRIPDNWVKKALSKIKKVELPSHVKSVLEDAIGSSVRPLKVEVFEDCVRLELDGWRTTMRITFTSAGVVVVRKFKEEGVIRGEEVTLENIPKLVKSFC